MQGRLKSRQYETREGEKRTVFEIEVEEVGPSAEVRHRQGHPHHPLRAAAAATPAAARAAPAAAASGGDDPWATPGSPQGGGGRRRRPASPRAAPRAAGGQRAPNDPWAHARGQRRHDEPPF